MIDPVDLITEIQHEIRDCGVDPIEFAKTGMAVEMIRCLIIGRWSMPQFKANVRKIAILNPKLKAGVDSVQRRSQIISSEIVEN